MGKSFLIIVIFVAALCVGCTTFVSPEWYQWADAVCSANAGLKEITILGPFYPNAICKNGAMFSATEKDFSSGATPKEN